MTSPEQPNKVEYCHINGTQTELLDRLAVTELCKGWPVYRDASEWTNFRSLFAETATVWTTWSGPLSIDDFIKISIKGKAQGNFIMHRECGTLVELKGDRAVGKMKATITQRFKGLANTNTDQQGGIIGTIAQLATPDPDPKTPEIEYDVDCDCRFIFFCKKNDKAEWKTSYVKLDYDKDKVVPANGRDCPTFSAEELSKYPEGYQYLGAAQAALGYKIDLSLPTPRNEYWWKLYTCMDSWLAGGDGTDLIWEH